MSKVAIVWDGLAIKEAVDRIASGNKAAADQLRYLEALRSGQPAPEAAKPSAIAENTDDIAKALSRLVAEDKASRAECRRLAMVAENDAKKAPAPEKPKRTGNPALDWRNQRHHETAMLAYEPQRTPDAAESAAASWPEPKGDFGASTWQGPIWSGPAMTIAPTPTGTDCRALLSTGFVWVADTDIENR